MDYSAHILCHLLRIHWSRVKQRPQCLAKKFTKDYTVSCFYGKKLNATVHRLNEIDGVKLAELPRIPMLVTNVQPLAVCNVRAVKRAGRLEGFAGFCDRPEEYRDAFQVIMKHISRKYGEAQRSGLLSESGRYSHIKPVHEVVVAL